MQPPSEISSDIWIEWDIARYNQSGKISCDIPTILECNGAVWNQH
jgi:hypothetical protein